MEFDFRTPLRWALWYRVLSLGALLLGVLLVVIGVLAGFGSTATTLVSDPASADIAIEQANPLITVAFVFLAIAVWQLGKTYALFVMLPQAAGRSAAEQFDATKLRSDILSGLDDRLADMQADIDDTHRSVQELKRSAHADQLTDEDPLFGSTAESDSVPDADSQPTGTETVSHSRPADDIGTSEEADSRSVSEQSIDDDPRS